MQSLDIYSILFFVCVCVLPFIIISLGNVGVHVQEGVAIEIAEAVVGALRGELAATAVNAPMVPAEVSLRNFAFIDFFIPGILWKEHSTIPFLLQMLYNFLEDVIFLELRITLSDMMMISCSCILCGTSQSTTQSNGSLSLVSSMRNWHG